MKCKDNTEKILPISYDKGTRSLDAYATQGEISQMRSVVGSLAWIARQVRPKLSYACSRMQSVVSKAQVKHLEFCNKVLQEAKKDADVGIYFEANLFDFHDAILLSISDASWAGETMVIQDKVFPRRSQYGFFTCLANPELWTEDQGNIHVIGWKSAIIKRQCRSTMRAETQAMTYAVDNGTYIRAAIARCRGLYSSDDWEAKCAKVMKHMWLTDCQSLHDYVNNPIASGSEDKRLEIDLEALREAIWFDSDDNLKDAITSEDNDKIRWIDTSTMIADPLTKSGNEKFTKPMDTTMMSGRINFIPSDESVMKKMKSQKARLMKVMEKNTLCDEGNEEE